MSLRQKNGNIKAWGYFLRGGGQVCPEAEEGLSLVFHVVAKHLNGVMKQVTPHSCQILGQNQKALQSPTPWHLTLGGASAHGSNMRQCLPYSPERSLFLHKSNKSSRLFPLSFSHSYRSGVSSVCETAQSTSVTKPDWGINEYALNVI